MARPANYGTLEQVLEIYAGVWGAAADAEGADYWVNLVNSGEWSYDDVADSFFDQPRVQGEYNGTDGTPLSGDTFLTALYQNIFKVDAPDTAGFSYWQGVMAEMGITDYNSEGVGSLVMQMIDGMWANEATVGTTQQLYQNWIEASVSFYQYQVDNNLTPFSELTAEEQATFFAAAANLVDGLNANSTQAEIDAAVDQANDAVDPNAVPTYTLEAFLALTETPDTYKLDANVSYSESDLTVEQASASYADVEAAIAGATNAADLDVATLYTWTLADTLANIEAAAGETVFTGATAYSLTDPAGNLGTLTAEQVALVEGASNGDDYSYGSAGNTVDLTTAVEVVSPEAVAPLATSADNDTINGVISSLSSANTLNQGDQIDGGAGTDTLNIDVQGNFNGFTGEGNLVNVEMVNLTNSGSISRAFNATGVSGVEEYNLDATGAAINLSNLADTDAAINVSNQSSGAVSIGFATDVTSGTSDDLTVGLMDVGTVKTTDVSEKSVTVTATGIETLALDVSGDNVAALGADDTKAITATGDGSLKLTDVGTAAKTFDGSAMTGDLDVNLGEATGMTSVSTGAGDDVIRAAAGSDVIVNAEIDGGEGSDTLYLTGGGTVQYVMGGVETIAVGNLASDLVLSAADTTGLERLVAQSGMDQDATFANLDGLDLSIDLAGANSAGATLSTDNSGSSTINVVASSAADEGSVEANNVNVTLGQSTVLDLNVGAFSNYAGTVTAAKATSGQISIDADGMADLDLMAATMTALQVVADGDTDLSGSTLAGLESLEVQTSADFSIGDLGKVSQVALQGSGSAILGDLGSSSLDYGVAVTATGLANSDIGVGGNELALKITSITTGNQAISVDASGVVGNIALGAIDAGSGSVTLDFDGLGGSATLRSSDATMPVIAGGAVTIDASGALGAVTIETAMSTRENAIMADTLDFTGSAIAANAVGLNVETSAVVTGGIADDTFVMSATNAAGETTTFTVTGGLGDDRFLVADGDTIGTTWTMEGSAKVTITDFNVGDATNIDTAAVDTYTNAADAATMLVDAGVTGANANNVTLIQGDDAQTAVVYSGSTYFFADINGTSVNDTSFDDGQLLIKLAGVTDLSSTEVSGFFTA